MKLSFVSREKKWGVVFTLCITVFLNLNSIAQKTSASCNDFTTLTNPTFGSLSVSSSTHTGIGIPPPQVDDFSNKANLTDSDITNSASYSFLLSGSAWIEVKDNVALGGNVYPAGSFAGFAIDDNTLLSAFGTVTISTYLGTTAQESVSTGSLVSTGLLSGVARAGFYTTKDFDRIRVTFTALGVGTVHVYYAIVERFCAGASLTCNTPTMLNTPTFPSFVNPANTGFNGLNVGTISNQDNAVSANTSDFASISLVASVGTASLAIKDALTDYPAGTFAGIDLSSPNLVNVGALSGFTLSTYLNGSPTGESVSDANLVSVGSALLSGNGRRTIGFVTTQAFDEIKLTLGGVNVLGLTNVYGAVFEKFCDGPNLDCADNTIPKNTLTPMTNPTFPVYVDGANTGFPGGVCAGCSINNSANVIDSDASNYASIVLTAGVTSVNFAVADARQTYPVKSFAGFDIQATTLLSANVLSTATITLYNNGTVVQTSSGNALIVGATTNLLNGTTRQIVGIVATAAYDEVKITFSQLVNANLGTINIYSAIFEKTCASAIACNTTYPLNNPGFPVVVDSDHTGVTGVVAAATTIQDAWNIVSSSTSDFARITNTGSVGTIASLAVLDPINTYPVGTFAGFTVRRVSGLALVNLLSAITITTYRGGVMQESKGAGNLLNLSISLFGSTTDFYNVGFMTTKAFDEVQISLANLADISALSGSLDVFGAFVDTHSSIGGGLLCYLNTYPDFNATNKNVPVLGSVSSNDIVPSGTTYGQPAGPNSQPAGSSPTLTISSTGSYTFVSSTAGVYVYSVPVCGPGQSGTGCSAQTLSITVLDPAVNTNNPVANPDVVSTTGSSTNASPVTINVRANDGPGNPGGSLSLPTLLSAPANGSASVDGNGNVVYTPGAGFYGTDMFTYQVCETPGVSLCASATVTITVVVPGSANSTLAADDYVSTYEGVPVSGNVKTNDSDPEGNTQTVTAQTTSIAGKGSLSLSTDGSYTYTPVAGATGPVDFSYVTTDNGSPSASAVATLHLLVNPFHPNPDFAVTNKEIPEMGSVRTNDVVPVGSLYGTPTLASQPSGSSPTLTLGNTGSYTFVSSTPGIYRYNVPVCTPGSIPTCTSQPLTITVQDPVITNNNPVANPDFASVSGAAVSPSLVTLSITANDRPGNAGGTLSTPTIISPPTHGTATIDERGNLVYTPTAGYYGVDAVIYQVCETPSTPSCSTALVTLTIIAPGVPATVSINDDYISTTGSGVNGNVLTNDVGNGLTVSSAGTTVTSSGTLVITVNGAYAFTPSPGISGPINYTYTACDSSTPSVCGTATLHILINQGIPDLTPIIVLPLGNFTNSSPENGRNLVVTLFEVDGYSTAAGKVAFTITAPLGYSIAFSNSITSIDVSGGNTTSVNNTNWTLTDNQGNQQLSLVMNNGNNIVANGKQNIGFTITRTSANSGSTSNITININDDVSKAYDGNPLNNIYVRIISGL